MAHVSTLLPEISILAYSYHTDRDQFTYDVEIYEQWAWLALEEGRFWYRLGTGRAVVEGECVAGDWILCPAGTSLQRKILQRCTYHFARFRTEPHDAPSQSLGAMSGLVTLRDTARLRLDFAALRNTRLGPQSEAWRCHVLLDLLRAAAWERLSQAASSNVDTAMEKIRDWIEKNIESEISIAALARDAGLTSPTFTRRFRAAIGETPQEYVLGKRLDLARQLLLDTDLSIEQVALRCGFANGFYFSRIWTKRFGIAPSRFRRLHIV